MMPTLVGSVSTQCLQVAIGLHILEQKQLQGLIKRSKATLHYQMSIHLLLDCICSTRLQPLQLPLTVWVGGQTPHGDPDRNQIFLAGTSLSKCHQDLICIHFVNPDCQFEVFQQVAVSVRKRRDATGGTGSAVVYHSAT